MFPFFSLPGEIRDKIYRYALVVPDGYVIDFTIPQSLENFEVSEFSPCAAQITNTANQHLKYSFPAYHFGLKHHMEVKPHRPIVQLLRTCKKIHKEAFHLLYSENTFAFAKPRHFRDFYKMAGKKNIADIRYLQITYLFDVCARSTFSWSVFVVDEAWAMDQLRRNCPKLLQLKTLYYNCVCASVTADKQIMQAIMDENARIATQDATFFWEHSELLRSFPLITPDKITTEHIYTDGRATSTMQRICFTLC